ncbi:MAG: HD domain-containing protein [Planctomycetes bacterium]|nr:HD domain-containing protein [Planctomycetota bacterium]
MLRVDLAKAMPGMTLAMPVRHPLQPRRILLKYGFQLDAGSIQSMWELGVRTLWVNFPSLSFLEKIVDPGVISAQSSIIESVSRTFEDTQRQVSARLPYGEYTRAIGELVNRLIENPQAALFMGDLMGSGADELMRHSSTVTYLCLLIGLKLEGYLVKQRPHIDPARAKEVSSLGLGAMMHDVGVPKLSKQIRSRYNNTRDETDPAWREHPSLGYEIVRGHIEPSAATVVLNHHQRYDGSGYSGSSAPVLSGDRIHVFARICGLAEQFDRMRFPVGRPAVPAVAVLGAFLQPSLFRRFDPNVVRALFAVVPPYPPGSMVRLSDGRWAVVIEHVPRDPCRPTVQIIPNPATSSFANARLGETIELGTLSRTHMVIEHEGVDVSDLNFARRALLQEDVSKAAYY